MDGTGVNQSFITGVDSPTGLAVDGAAHLLDQLRRRHDRAGEPRRHRRQPELHLRRGQPDGVAVDGAAHLLDQQGDAARSGGRTSTAPASTRASSPAPKGLEGNPAVSVPVAQAENSESFANTPQGSLSAPSTVTLRNTGQRSLSLTGLSFAGADPSDFLATTGTCLGNIDPGHSCQLQAYFSPQGQGARSGDAPDRHQRLRQQPIAGATAGTGAGVSLVSAGPRGPTGTQGPAGSQGRRAQPGPTGPVGPQPLTSRRDASGKVELITCKTVNRTVIKKLNGKRRKVRVKRQKCTSTLVSGKVKFTIANTATHATISRKRTVYATGVPLSNAKRSLQLVVTELRPLRPGRYTLTLQSRHGRRSMTRHTQITIS